MKTIQLYLILIFCMGSSYGQYRITGEVSPDYKNGIVYFSAIDHIEKISGVFQDQILQKTTLDNHGRFSFEGDFLPMENGFYRIHVDTCHEDEKALNHFDGHCANSEEIIFIANNQSKIQLPLKKNFEMFTCIEGNQDTSGCLIIIDSLKSKMTQELVLSDTKAIQDLNTEKWFDIFKKTIQELKEPLAGLYAYSFLSHHQTPFYPYFKNDVLQSEFYDQFLERFSNHYPTSPYTVQLQNQLIIERFQPDKTGTKLSLWFYVILVLLTISLSLHLSRFRKKNSNEKPVIPEPQTLLSGQEQNIFNLLQRGLSNKEIANELYISLSTVKTHVSNIYKKLNINSRKEIKNI